MAGKINERFNLEAHVPRWKERLILKPREMIRELEYEEGAPIDISQTMLNTIIDLEKELKMLKIRLNENKIKERINEDDVDRL